MILRIDDDLPMVWRTPRSMQFGGIHPLAIIDDVGRTELALLEALRRGVTRSTLEIIALQNGGDDRDVDILLAIIEPALRMQAGRRVNDERISAGMDPPVVAIDGGGRAASELATALTEIGCGILPSHRLDSTRPALAVLVADYVVPPARQFRWMRDDIPHLALVFHDAGASIGPLVEPGDGPCLRCLDLARCDADSAWPTVASQLLGRTIDPAAALIRLATATATTVIDGRLHRGEYSLSRAAVDVTVNRESQVRMLEPHPECGCRSLEGSVTALADLAAACPAPTNSVQAVAVPA